MAAAGFLRALPVEGLSPGRLWAHLDPEVRSLAARALYAHPWGDAPVRREADAAIAQALRFRDASVRKLPVEQRAAHLSRSVRPSDSLAGSLLLALHLEHRRPMLSDFLDALGLSHRDGVISEDRELSAPDPADLGRAAETIFQRYPARDAETYLATLLSMDPDVWGGLAEVLASRS